MALSVPLSRFTSRVGGGSAFFVRHRLHFMRITHFITIVVAALAATFAVSCSKSSSPIPDVSFQGYTVESNGVRRAVFEFKNPSQSPIACQLHFQSEDSIKPGIVTIPAGGSVTDKIYIEHSNPTALSVTVVQLVPVHQFSVPIPNTAPTP